MTFLHSCQCDMIPTLPLGVSCSTYSCSLVSSIPLLLSNNFISLLGSSERFLVFSTSINLCGIPFSFVLSLTEICGKVFEYCTILKQRIALRTLRLQRYKEQESFVKKPRIQINARMSAFCHDVVDLYIIALIFLDWSLLIFQGQSRKMLSVSVIAVRP